MRFFIGVLLVSFSLASNGQIFNPVKWNFDSKHIKDNVYELSFDAKIEDTWHLYSAKGEVTDYGPIPTTFTFDKNAQIELIGSIEESKPVKEYEAMFEMDVMYFAKKAHFSQRVKLLSENATVKGFLNFMVCNDKQCLPPEDVDFSFDLKAVAQGKVKMEEVKVEEEASIQQNQEQSQVLNPVSWEFSATKLGAGEYELVLTAKIEKGWHLYSQNLESADGPVATEFRFFNDDKKFETVGKTEEDGNLHNEYDKNFMMDLAFYEGEVSFKQKVNSKGAASIKGDVYFMVCDESKCLPPEAIEFNIELPEYNGEIGGASAGSENEKSESETSMWEIFMWCFLGGLGALLTPCVFPMIPMTVSFFTKQSKTKAEGVRKGVIYGLSIILIYTAFSIPFHIFSSISPDIFNDFATDPYLNLFFFVVFMVFAISFLGAFEITLPSSWVNKADANADKGGLIGVFFMALTLILVSFSCTGPAIGFLLGNVLSTAGGATYLSVGLFGFGLGLGLPFGLFAAFPGWMNSLPQSGGWLNSVKVVFGFVELAFAFKFLSNADLVTQSGYLSRELFIAIWIAVSAMLTLYLLGLIRLPHDSKIEKLSVGRTLLATLSFMFTMYLIPGLWGAPLKLIAGFPPPMFYSESPKGVGKTATIMANNSTQHSEGSNSHSNTCPHSLNCFHDYAEGLAYAKKVGKPVMLDFTGWACVNCRKMEEQVWSEEPVLTRLRNEVVLISLYVDEKAELPEKEQYTSPVTGKKIKTVGNKWSDFQITNYKSNSQPYYVILDHEEKQLIESAAYDPDIPKFIDWLDRGVAEFKAKK